MKSYEFVEKSEQAWAVPYAMIIMAAMILASNHIIARYFNGILPPVGLVFWRMTIGSVVLLPFAIKGVINHRCCNSRALEIIFYLWPAYLFHLEMGLIICCIQLYYCSKWRRCLYRPAPR